MKKLIPSILLMTITSIIYAGEVTGTVTNTKTNSPVDYGSVTIYNMGFKRTTNILPNGDYSFGGLSAGTYTIATQSNDIYDTIEGVIVNNDGVTYLAINLVSKSNNLEGTTVSAKSKYGNALINPHEVHPELVTTEKEIKNMGPVKITDIVKLNSGVNVNENNEISIRGSRPTATRIMVDGVYSNVTVPTTSIKYVKVYTGGIPAKYGDTSGGVIVIETKGYFDTYK